MRYKQNLHTHTTYCDGKNSVEEVILAACEKGFESIGFSSHSFFDERPMEPSQMETYKQQVRVCSEKYADRIEIFCGLECEMRDAAPKTGFDYLIGSVHYLPLGEDLLSLDINAQCVRAAIDTHFGGDGLAYAKAYYQELSLLPQFGKYDIIAHFDLITKFSEQEKLFDENAKEYQWAAIEAAEMLAGQIPYFEVNTGACARGYRTSPYPDLFLLKELKRLGFGAVISSDCHNCQFLDHMFLEAEELLRLCGFKERYILTKDGFIPVAL